MTNKQLFAIIYAFIYFYMSATDTSFYKIWASMPAPEPTTANKEQHSFWDHGSVLLLIFV